MKNKTYIKFPIGNLFLTVEGGSGYVDEHPDTVNVAIRERTVKGAAGARVGVDFSARRAQIMTLGQQLLEVAQRMSPETLWRRRRRPRAFAAPNVDQQ